MKAQLKPLFYFLEGLLALIGLAACALVTIGCLCYPWGVRDYTGADCGKSLVSRRLPLPKQTEEHMPMVLEKYHLNSESGLIIFRADEEWQQAFRDFYPAEPVKDAWMAECLAVDWSADLEDDRIHYFVKGRRWQPFHTGHMQGHAFIALRDESGHYLLVYFR